MTVSRLKKVRLPLLSMTLLMVVACNDASLQAGSNVAASHQDTANASRGAMIASAGDGHNSSATQTTKIDPRSENQMSSSPAFSVPTCDNMRSQFAQGVTPDAVFETYMPPVIVGETVNDIEISAVEMKHLVGFLACSAKAFDWDANVPDAAGNLFTSPRHKKAAFAALDAIAQGTGEDADAARKFAEQMRHYNFGPNG